MSLLNIKNKRLITAFFLFSSMFFLLHFIVNKLISKQFLMYLSLSVIATILIILIIYYIGKIKELLLIFVIYSSLELMGWMSFYLHFLNHRFLENHLIVTIGDLLLISFIVIFFSILKKIFNSFHVPKSIK